MLRDKTENVTTITTMILNQTFTFCEIIPWMKHTCECSILFRTSPFCSMLFKSTHWTFKVFVMTRHSIAAVIKHLGFPPSSIQIIIISNLPLWEISTLMSGACCPWNQPKDGTKWLLNLSKNHVFFYNLNHWVRFFWNPAQQRKKKNIYINWSHILLRVSLVITQPHWHFLI